MLKILTALLVLGSVTSGRASDTTQTTTTTTTERKADGDRVKTTMETKSKSDGAAGEATRDETFTVERHVPPGGNTEMKKDVKTSHRSGASGRTRTHVEEKTVRDAQGNTISYEKNVK